MPLATQARNRGQSLVEALLTMSVTLVFALGVVWISLKLATLNFVRLDTYLLARAQLYSQQNFRCSPSSSWPAAKIWRVRYRCLPRARVMVLSPDEDFQKISWNL